MDSANGKQQRSNPHATVVLQSPRDGAYCPGNTSIVAGDKQSALRILF